jgi:HD superfamily phosphohydrolase
MIFVDKIYGFLKADEPIFEKIILSKPFQRLYGIHMGGWAPGCPFQATPHTRYEHSIGAFMLLRKYGASIEEQIAGLIHDVSHTAFSHLADRLFGDKYSGKTSEYQDSIHSRFVKNSELADIITGEGFDLDYILDESHFKLQEKIYLIYVLTAWIIHYAQSRTSNNTENYWILMKKNWQILLSQRLMALL